MSVNCYTPETLIMKKIITPKMRESLALVFHTGNFGLSLKYVTYNVFQISDAKKNNFILQTRLHIINDANIKMLLRFKNRARPFCSNLVIKKFILKYGSPWLL